MNQITEKTALELAAHEGLVREAYKDSVGVWTWSIGITSASGHDVMRYRGNPQALEHCLAVWVWTLESYADDVRKVFAGQDLTEAQFAAALSFHYNTGGIRRASWVDHWKVGNRAKAKKAFMNWSKPSEIIPRRKAERDLFFDGVWTNDGTVTEYTRVSSSGNIQWSSAVRTDIRGPLRRAMGPAEAHDAPASPDTSEKPQGIWAAILAALARIFGKGKP